MLLRSNGEATLMLVVLALWYRHARNRNLTESSNDMYGDEAWQVEKHRLSMFRPYSPIQTDPKPLPLAGRIQATTSEMMETWLSCWQISFLYIFIPENISPMTKKSDNNNKRQEERKKKMWEGESNK